jgi:2-polyprenyl-3-methyl-5-hydroxy-6-metoxy-1,4-benzoquinol methylase
MEHIHTCPVCGSTNKNPFLACTDFTVSHETFQLHKCNQCSLVITSPRPFESEIAKYYLSDEYISHSGKSSGIGFFYNKVRSHSLKWKGRIVLKYRNEKSSALDFGCGTGEFVQTLTNQKWNVIGVEPSSIAREKALTLNPNKIVESLNQVNSTFEIITLWHVLEHIPDLNEKLKNLSQLLTLNGTLFIAVPNHTSYDAKHYQSYWAGYDVPRHLWHFSKQSMQTLVHNHGLKIVDIVPMKFDSFYVSLLSEKYKNNNNLNPVSFIKAFITGLRSNLKANGNNYSSLIYVVKKS